MKNYKIVPLMIAMAALSGHAQSAVQSQPPQTAPVQAQKETLFMPVTIDVDGQDYLFAVRKDASGAVFAQHRSHSSHSSHSSHRSHYSSR